MTNGIEAPPRIRVLSTDLVNQIAAGEVVERPASVVKELLENALDAEAARIEISLSNAGLGEILIRDDGTGMSRDEARLALVRHATSKLASEEDLRRLSTFGFRGEALPAIAAVCRLRLVTRRVEDPEGTEVTVEDGEEPEVRPAGAAPGTLVRVRDLFYRTPARRKFLKSPRTELAGCIRAVEWLALAHPAAAFTLTHDGRPLRRFLPQRRAADRVAEVLPDTRIHEIAGSLEGLDVLAFLGPPEDARPGGRRIEILVNGRRVQDRTVVAAVVAAHEGTLERGLVPPGVLFLNLDPAHVDVNVHPRKDEVRFSNPRQIHSAVFHLLRDGLARAPWAAGRILPTVPARFDPAPPAFALRSDPPNAPLPLWLGAGRVADGEGGPVPFAPAPPLPEAAASAPFPDAPPDDSSSRPAGFFARLVPVGQAFLTYLVCQSDDRLILIDQHAAHERIVYEDLRRAIARGAVPSQALLSPESFPVPPELLALLEDEGETLARLGFDVEPFGPDRARLRAHPAGLALPPAEALRRTLETLRHGPGAERSTLERGLETVACHSAVRAGRRLAEPEILALLQRMDEVDFGAFCPHGRPAWVGVSRDDIERMFHRR